MTTESVKHTPGPWKHVRATNNGSGGYIDSDDVQICEIAWQHDTAIDKANARLIAAAPDLLEALISVEEYVSSTEKDHHGPSLTAQAAIAKATGEPSP